MNSVFVFKDHVFEEPYKPYYDAYKGEVFIVNRKKEAPMGHVWLDCLSNNNIKVENAVHLHDIEPYQWYYHKGESK